MSNSMQRDIIAFALYGDFKMHRRSVVCHCYNCIQIIEKWYFFHTKITVLYFAMILSSWFWWLHLSSRICQHSWCLHGGCGKGRYATCQCGFRGGIGARTPWKITSYIGFIEISIWTPWKKLDPPPPLGKCWTPAGSFEKDSFLRIKPLDPLCKLSIQLRKKKEKKNVVQTFLAIGPGPPWKFPGSAHVRCL